MNLRFSRTVVWWQILIVLGLSLGRSGVYAIVTLAERLAVPTDLSDQTAALNQSLSVEPVFDLIRQLLGIGFGLVPVLLVFHLMWIYGRHPCRTLGLDFRRPWADLGLGVALFVIIGAGTVLIYQGGRALGVTTAIVGSGLAEHWWSTPVLFLSALRHSLVEEIIVLAWLVDRLSLVMRTPFPDAEPADNRLWLPTGAWQIAVVVLASALIRASYHLYQGFGPGIGNFLMGVVFVAVFLWWKRIMPLVWAHLFLDVAGFIGYPLLANLGWLG